jgi:hypothetical protein
MGRVQGGKRMRRLESCLSWGEHLRPRGSQSWTLWSWVRGKEREEDWSTGEGSIRVLSVWQLSVNALLCAICLCNHKKQSVNLPVPVTRVTVTSILLYLVARLSANPRWRPCGHHLRSTISLSKHFSLESPQSTIFLKMTIKCVSLSPLSVSLHNFYRLPPSTTRIRNSSRHQSRQ